MKEQSNIPAAIQTLSIAKTIAEDVWVYAQTIGKEKLSKKVLVSVSQISLSAVRLELDIKKTLKQLNVSTPEDKEIEAAELAFEKSRDIYVNLRLKKAATT